MLYFLVDMQESITPPGSQKIDIQFRPLQLAFELGYMIAIPIVAFALAGRFADKYFETSPWLLLAGICTSILISSYLVYKKVAPILTGNNDNDNDNDKRQ